MTPSRVDVIVVGGGHAGAEAAWSAANLGARVVLVTLDPSRIALMPCNPSIGGLAKGQMVREIDALGGLMGVAADATGIMFKTLNASRGPAVRGPRCQCDKHAYSQTAHRLLRARPEIEIMRASVERVLVERGRVVGVVAHQTGPIPERERRVSRASDTAPRADSHRMSPTPAPSGNHATAPIVREIRAPSVVITTGTFMRALMHRGAERTEGGRDGEAAATGIALWLRDAGFELGRLKTGTPPRIDANTIDWSALDAQDGDDPPVPFSDLTPEGLNPAAGSFPSLAQVRCAITATTPKIHDLIRANLHLSPMYNGQIASTGPRYCPSIEDKVVRFADRGSHHVFLEPESHQDDSVYCNGVSTSLPAHVQREIVRGMPGCARAKILKFGYAVEYDSVRPHQIDATCMTKRIAGLFFAGQINGTSGYEEAAGQGLLAGLNAVRVARGEAPITLGRDQAYLGVMMDDLVTSSPVEPYRMFTSRAEHRLLLRADNAADRLTPLGRELGLVDDARWNVFERRRRALGEINERIDATRIAGEPLARALKRPGFSAADLARSLDLSSGTGVSLVEKHSGTGVSPVEKHHGAALSPVGFAAAMGAVLADRQYAGYLDRQRAEIKRHAEMESRRIPVWIEFSRIIGLRAEARETLSRFRPATFGQAGRLEGVTPADLSLVLIAARRGADQASERESLTPRLA